MDKLNFVLLGWIRDLNGYRAYSSPLHRTALKRITGSEYTTCFLNSSDARQDALWRYYVHDGSLGRYGGHMHLVGENMRGFLGPMCEMIVQDHTELVQLFSRSTPQRIADDARAIILRHREGIRKRLSTYNGNGTMFDAVANIKLRTSPTCTADAEYVKEACVVRDVKGLSASSVAWNAKDARLEVCVPGIPAYHPMADWDEENARRINTVRRLVTDMLSD